tara:strand:+ start:4373 stop:4921 length:549 start_codon:yes stop_codon:yes gene_type:complete
MSNIWTKNPSVLFNYNNLGYFIPTDDMTYIEKLNAITRFIIYLSVLIFIVHGDVNIFFLPILVMLFIYFIVNWGLGLDELNEQFRVTKTESCQNPTVNNPFMNILPVDERDRDKACDYDSEVKETINSKFNVNLYKDLNDVFDRNNSQRQFYTMPSSTIPNNQTDFAKWLYDTKPICKEGNC